MYMLLSQNTSLVLHGGAVAGRYQSRRVSDVSDERRRKSTRLKCVTAKKQYASSSRARHLLLIDV